MLQNQSQYYKMDLLHNKYQSLDTFLLWPPCIMLLSAKLRESLSLIPKGVTFDMYGARGLPVN